jgi:hypothetical protein
VKNHLLTCNRNWDFSELPSPNNCQRGKALDGRLCKLK